MYTGSSVDIFYTKLNLADCTTSTKAIAKTLGVTALYNCRQFTNTVYSDVSSESDLRDHAH